MEYSGLSPQVPFFRGRDACGIRLSNPSRLPTSHTGSTSGHLFVSAFTHPLPANNNQPTTFLFGCPRTSIRKRSRGVTWPSHFLLPTTGRFGGGTTEEGKKSPALPVQKRIVALGLRETCNQNEKGGKGDGQPSVGSAALPRPNNADRALARTTHGDILRNTRICRTKQ